MQFIDLKAQQARISDKIESAIAAVLKHGHFIMGPEVGRLELELAAFSRASHCISCANGTEAIALILMAWGIRPNDAIFCPSFTFSATAETIPWLGAEPVFVDVHPETCNIDVDHLEVMIAAVRNEGKLTPRAIVAVDLFGQAADYVRLRKIADKYSLKLIADSAQGFGTTINGRHPSDWADATTTSFFPAKPLGCYGDGGAILTNDAELAEVLESLRVHGKATESDIKRTNFTHDPKYLNLRIGMNSRLDTIQAAILLEKLSIFPDEIERRNAIAARYREALVGRVAEVPTVPDGVISTWAQYTIQHANRDGLHAHLRIAGIPSAVYYPVPIHKNLAYEQFSQGRGSLPVTEMLARCVLSLPMHPYLSEKDQDRVIFSVLEFSG